MTTAPLKTRETLRTGPETVSVGAAELRRLQACWYAFVGMSDRNYEQFDPVASLRHAGAVIDAVGSVMATIKPSPGEQADS
ncbi:hypothetical protein AB4068_15535 [Arthrobacter sp. 2RAF22]|uniref:hypothetical protein n=1 Tax=Arthrobacter sp. 2RAF22 TaxID=3232996 RepID=UPI003F8DC9AD